MDMRADEVGAADLGKRIRFTTVDGALIEDELVVLHAEQVVSDGPFVLFGVKHVRPGGRDLRFQQQEYGYLFGVSGPTRVELTDKA